MPEDLASLLKKRAAADPRRRRAGAATEPAAPDQAAAEPEVPAPPPQFSGPGAPDCPICHGMGYVRAEVPVGHPQFGKMQICVCRQSSIARQRAASLLRFSELGTRQECTFDSFRTDVGGLYPAARESLSLAYSAAREYAASPAGWIVFYGGVGTGKSHLAAAIANQRVALGHQVMFVNVPNLLDHLRATFAPSSETTFDQRFTDVCEVELLVLDDLGAENPSPWAREKLFQIIDSRWQDHRPTIVTTNLTPSDFEPRVRSRVFDMTHAKVVQIIAPDYRAGVRQDSYVMLSTLGQHTGQTFASFTLRQDLVAADREKLKETVRHATQYAAKPRGWLCIQGVSGAGKTHLAAAVANEVHDRGKAVLFVTAADLLDHLRAAFSNGTVTSYERRMEELRGVELLVLDDLGGVSPSPWGEEKLHQILGWRYESELPTVLTITVVKDPWLEARIANTNRCQVLMLPVTSYHGRQQAKTRPARQGRSDDTLPY